MPPRVFLDTTVMKLAADRVVRGFERTKTLQWGAQTVTHDVVQFRYVPKLPQRGTKQFQDAALLPFIAQLAKRGRLELVWHLDGELEFWRLTDIDRPGGRFFGAPVTWARAPDGHARLIADGLVPKDQHRALMRQLQVDSLRKCTHPRFLELQKAVGANEGSGHFENQLLDAFHLWCAEHAGARYFLTADYIIGKHLERSRQVQPTVDVVTPGDLLRDLRRRREISFWDALEARLTKLRLRLNPPPPSGLEDLVRLGERLEAQGYYD